MTEKTIQLGSTVRCVATGLQGFAMTMTEMFNGNIRYGVQPKDADGSKIPDSWDVDHQTLDVIDDGISARSIKAPPNRIKVGERVKDMLSGFEGIASSKTTHFNGCVYCTVIPQVKEKALLNEAPTGSYIPVERLTKVDEGVMSKREEASKPELRTGGPSTKSQKAL